MKTFLKYTAIALAGMMALLIGVYLYVISGTTKQGDITWRSCYRPQYLTWFLLPPPPSLQCAYVSVPVDYDKPDGKTFSIALTRLPSKGSEPIGDLLLLNGGPGGHSLDMGYLTLGNPSGKQIQERFHILGYAPRGIAPSAPAIDCGGIEEEGNAKAYMDACIQHTGEDVLPFVGSKEVLKDLDAIRRALGDEVWSMVGYSYGTKLVAKYAEHYPAHLRAGVADGVVDTSEDLKAILGNQNAHAQRAFERFMAWCQDCIFDKNTPPNEAFLDALSAIEKQALKDDEGETIDKESMLSLFNEGLNDEGAWSDLKAMFDELSAGKTDKYNTQKLFSKLGEKGFSKDGLAIINCADSAPKLSQDDYIAHQKDIDDKAGYDAIKMRQDNDYLDACYYWRWQAGDDLTENFINEQTPNLLFVSYEHDFATPYANAQNMAKRFDDPLIVVSDKQGHTVSLFGDNQCVDKHVVRYLLEPTVRFDDKLLICPKS